MPETLQQKIDLIGEFLAGNMKFRDDKELSNKVYSLILLAKREGMSQEVIDKIWKAYHRYCEI